MLSRKVLVPEVSLYLFLGRLINFFLLFCSLRLHFKSSEESTDTKPLAENPVNNFYQTKILENQSSQREGVGKDWRIVKFKKIRSPNKKCVSQTDILSINYCSYHGFWTYEGGIKVFRLAYLKLRTSGCWIGNRTGAGVTATLREWQSFFGHSPWLHGHQWHHTGKVNFSNHPYITGHQNVYHLQ